MGDVISLEQHRSARALQATSGPGVRGPVARPAIAFSFDLASPWTYVAAERVERAFPGASWHPVAAHGDPAATGEREREAAEARAAELGLPLVWPERARDGGRVAMRVAAWAAEQGQAPAFVLAASRLAFCGGFDLDDPEILAEAAAAAGLGLEPSLRAAGDGARDAALAAAGEALRAQGADRLPVVRVGRLLFCGEQRLAEAAAAARDPLGERRRAPRESTLG